MARGMKLAVMMALGAYGKAYGKDVHHAFKEFVSKFERTVHNKKVVLRRL